MIGATGRGVSSQAASKRPNPLSTSNLSIERPEQIEHDCGLLAQDRSAGAGRTRERQRFEAEIDAIYGWYTAGVETILLAS